MSSAATDATVEVRKIFPDGVDKVLELIGTTTLDDSMNAAKKGGIVCMTGIVGNVWSYKDFNPMVLRFLSIAGSLC